MSGDAGHKTIDGTDLRQIERQTQVLGRDLLAALHRERPRPWRRSYWDDRLMAWAMRDEAVKVRLFRFVDVLPMLRTPAEIIEHLHEYLGEVAHLLPRTLRFGLAAARPGTAAGRGLAVLARAHVESTARRFIAGGNVAEVLRAVRRARRRRRAYTLDILGEAVTNEIEAEQYQQAYLDLMRGVAAEARHWPPLPLVDRSAYGPLPRTNLSVKLSALDSHFDPIDAAGARRRVGARLRELLRAARRCGAFLNVDMESYATKNLTLEIFREVLEEAEFRDMTDVGIVIQAYLHDAERDFDSLLEWARRRGAPIWVRLVKGAYWDYETIHAGSEGWPIPVFQRKARTDASYERLTRKLIEARRWLRPQLAGHNVRSLAHGIATARRLGLPPEALELQMLYGMGEPLQEALTRMGYRVRVYMPYGELIPGMAYLVRRLLENTSNDSFLRASGSEGTSPEELLADPAEFTATEQSATTGE